MWSPTLTAASREVLRANTPADSTTTADKPTGQAASATDPAEGVQVKLSLAGQAKAAMAPTTNADIKNSGLPDSVQKILTSLRASQQRLDKLNDQLQAAMKDQSLTPEMRQAKVAALQMVLSIVQRQISNSAGDLSANMNQLKLKSADKMKASMLVMAKM